MRGLGDEVVADPAHTEGDAGEIVIYRTGAGDSLSLRGSDPNDRFGEAAALTDWTGNGALDLLVGAPAAPVATPDGLEPRGLAYLFHGPFDDQGQEPILATDANVTLGSTIGDTDHDFAGRVAPLCDMTGDGLPEIRVRSKGKVGSVFEGYILTHVFRTDGAPLFIIMNSDEFDLWTDLPGDVTGDGAVRLDDLETVIANYGLESDQLARIDGDLNQDGVVDILDVMQVLENLGTQLLHLWYDENGIPAIVGARTTSMS